ELCNLQWSQVQLATGRLHVRSGVRRRRGHCRMGGSRCRVSLRRAAYWAPAHRWPRAKIASRHAARIVRLGTVLVEAGGVSRCATGSAESQSPIWLAGAAALVEAGGVSCGATRPADSRSTVRLPGTGELAARGRAM